MQVPADEGMEIQPTVLSLPCNVRQRLIVAITGQRLIITNLIFSPQDLPCPAPISNPAAIDPFVLQSAILALPLGGHQRERRTARLPPARAVKEPLWTTPRHALTAHAR